MKVQVSNDHYFDLQYLSRGRFASYWHQLAELTPRKFGKILEIGVGPGIGKQLLSSLNKEVVSMDFDISLQPEVQGYLPRLPFRDQAFDAACAFQVLEHLPFHCFVPALEELARVSSDSIFISLPDAGRNIRFAVHVLNWRLIEVVMPLPAPRHKSFNFDGEHYWEIGRKQYRRRVVEAEIGRAGLKITKTYRVFDFPYHRFYHLTI